LGEVKEIGVRSSKINNKQGADIIVPNGDLLSQHLINWTMQDRNKQIDFAMSIPYQANIKMVKTLIGDILLANEKVMAKPGPEVTVQHLGDHAIDIKVSFWVHDLADAGAIRSNTMVSIHETLSEAGIQLPVYKSSLSEQRNEGGE
jgi:small-conductance mechanosensitive channel